tara:strand:+ start:803 stop:1258 length:456 start_codon:yes stop_codon:yes gene_type:complete
MAVASVQQYLNMALSLTTSNKSKTDVEYSLPDDLRRYENLKVKNQKVFKFEQAGMLTGDTAISITRLDGDDSLCLVFASHPISIAEINGSAISNTLRTSFFAIGRDRSGAYGATATAFKYRNNLHGPNYTSDSGGATATVELLIVQITFEA